MPLLPPEEIRSITPLYDKWWGKAVIDLGRNTILKNLRAMYDRNEQYSGREFAMHVLTSQECDYEIGNVGVLSTLPADEPFVVISNHPYGGLDGLVMVDLFGGLRPGFKVLVNKIITYLHALDESFIPVTPTGEQRTAPTQDSIRGIRIAMKLVREGHPIGIFPSGAVSDLSPKTWKIADRPWQEPIIRLISKLGVPVLPFHFLDRNTMWYYLLGLVDWKVRLMRLPDEVVNKKGKRVRVVLGDLVSPEAIASFGKDTQALSDFLRGRVYDMPTPAPEEFVRRSSLGYGPSLVLPGS